MSIRFFVPGIPAPKGSTRAFFVKALGRAVITNANAKTKPWEQAVRAEALNAVDPHYPTTQPIAVHATFYFSRPKGHYRTNGEVKPGAPGRHVTKPDLDKLERALLDAMTGIVFVDDSQVCELSSDKRFAMEQGPGVNVIVSILEQPNAGSANG